MNSLRISITWKTVTLRLEKLNKEHIESTKEPMRVMILKKTKIREFMHALKPHQIVNIMIATKTALHIILHIRRNHITLQRKPFKRTNSHEMLKH